MREETLTVGDVTRLVARAVSRALPDAVWVEGEIRDLSRSAQGHVYFSLVDPESGQPESLPAAMLPVTLFASDRDVVNRALVNAGAPRMTDGMRVRVRGTVSLYGPRSTVQLRMTSIDTDYTVGAYVAARARILRLLAKEGLLDRNRSLPVGLVPLRIGMITSAGSAAEADFVTELTSSGFAFRVFAFDVRVQGPLAATLLTQTITAVGASAVDIVAVVRGGGAQSDLAAFDDEGVARAIATAPVPVFTGIGHEIDEAIADRVAHSPHKTPTACAAAIVGHVAGFERQLENLGGSIAAGAQHRLFAGVRRLNDLSGRSRVAATNQLRSGSRRLDRSRLRVEGATGVAVARAERRLATLTQRTSRLAPRRIEEATRLVAGKEQVLAAHDPQKALERGWSVVRDDEGRLVRSVDDVGPGDTMTTTLADGDVLSRVDGSRRRPAGDR